MGKFLDGFNPPKKDPEVFHWAAHFRNGIKLINGFIISVFLGLLLKFNLLKLLY